MVYVHQQLFIGAVCLATISLFIILLPLKKRNSHPYERIDSILTPAEQHFYKVLASVLQDSVLIMVKVRIADVIKVKRTRTMKVFWHHFSKISQKLNYHGSGLDLGGFENLRGLLQILN